MTFDELQDACWSAMPRIRRRIAGRDAVNDFVWLAVQNWEPEYLSACMENNQQRVYADVLLKHIKSAHQATSEYDAHEYGFIWAFLLQAVAVAVIQWLVQWWLEGNAHRGLMAGWKRELTR